LLVAWAVSAPLGETIKIYFKIKYLQISWLLLGLLALGTLYGAARLEDAWSTLGKYADLLLIPVFAVVFSRRTSRQHALHAYAITMAVVIVLSYLIHFGLIAPLPIFTGTAAMPTVFKLKITHSLFVAFSAFLYVWLGRSSTHARLRWLWYALALLAALNVLVMVQGATGYVTLGLLILLLGYERLGVRGLLYALFGVSVVGAALMILPTPFRDRVSLIGQEIAQWQPRNASESSTGLRLEFYRNTLDIIAAHPLAGVGTGGFPGAYAKQVQGTGKVATHNPHNEFLHVWAQIGVVGLATLLALFWAQWRSARFADNPMEKALVHGLVLTMAAGCVFNSLLFDHAEGLFYAWLSGLLAGGLKYAASGPSSAP
jgi:O-antigen ligase